MKNIIQKSTGELMKELVENFELVIDIHSNSKVAIADNDSKRAIKVIDMHTSFTKNYILYKSNVMFALTKKPLAKDLRATVGSLLIMKDLENISNFARKIARFTISKGESISSSSQERIRKIHKPLRKMMELTLKTLQTEQQEDIEEVLIKEEEINGIMHDLREKIVKSVSTKQDKKEIDERLFMLDVINSQEKAGDSLISICQTILYIKTGSHVSLK